MLWQENKSCNKYCYQLPTAVRNDHDTFSGLLHFYDRSIGRVQCCLCKKGQDYFELTSPVLCMTVLEVFICGNGELVKIYIYITSTNMKRGNTDFAHILQLFSSSES